jgi:hypothetical protein
MMVDTSTTLWRSLRAIAAATRDRRAGPRHRLGYTALAATKARGGV